MKVFVIAGHAQNSKKIEITRKFIEKIRNRYEQSKIVYTSHLVTPKEIEKLVDYSVYVKYNPIQNIDIITPITQEFAVPYWKVVQERYNIVKPVPTHSYAHHNSLVQAFQLLHNHNLTNKVHFLNYDCDEDTFDSIDTNHDLLDAYDAVFFPYRYDPTQGVCTEFFSLSKNAIENMFLKMDSYGTYEGINIVRPRDYNIEYTYFSHLNHRKIRYHVHDMWPTRGGEIGKSHFEDINMSDDINLGPNNPQNRLLSIIPFMDPFYDFKLRILLMRFGNQSAENFVISFMNEEFEKLADNSYKLAHNTFMFISPESNSKYLSFNNDEFRFTFDLTDVRNFGKLVDSYETN